MKAVRAILRLELRLLRRDLLLGGGVLLVAIGLLLAAEGRGAGSTLAPFVRGSVLVVFVLLVVFRVALAHNAWTGLHGALPVTGRHLALSGLALWGVVAFLPACAYALWVSPCPTLPVARPLVAWLWLVLAGTITTLGLGIRGNVPRRWGDIALALLAFYVLSDAGRSLIAVAEEVDQLAEKALMLGVALACTLLLRPVIAQDEWLPSPSPKEVRPRPRFIGGLLRRRPFARTPRQVLAHLGVRGMGVSPAGIALFSYGALFMIAYLDPYGADRSVSPAEVTGTTAVVVLVLGIFLAGQLTLASARWSFLRAYPLSRAAVWTRPVLAMVAVPLLALGLAWWVRDPGGPVRIVASYERDKGMDWYAHRAGPVPALSAPGWAFVKGATEGRPAGMPAPGRAPWREVWTLRARHKPALGPGRDPPPLADVDERRDFIDRLRFYLKFVHGVKATDAELADALDASFVFQAQSAVIPAQHFFEHVEAYGYGLFSDFNYRPLLDGVQVEALSLDDHLNRPGPVVTRFTMCAYAPALERIQTRFADRLARAAWLRTVLDLCVLLVALLLFVRLALIEGPMRVVLPLLALLPVVFAHGGRATAPWRAVRNGHLAQPWIAPVLTLVLGVLLVLSIKRQLGRAAPPTLPY